MNCLVVYQQQFQSLLVGTTDRIVKKYETIPVRISTPK